METIAITSGPIKATFHPQELLLRYVQVDGSEALRGICFAMRDQNWDTVPPIVENLESESDEQGFRIQFDFSWKSGPIQFAGQATLGGNAQGTIAYRFSGDCQQDFLKNRLGFVVLHGAQLAGKPCHCLEVTGSQLQGVFPASISPHQPFKNLRSIRHSLDNGQELEVLMEGDTFEMEDQRNWTDASYKTYCTPLELPFPVQMKAGDSVSQKIELSLHGTPNDALPPTASPTRLSLSNAAPSYSIPHIGLALSPDDSEPYSPAEIERLATLHLDHLRIDLHLVRPDWNESLAHGQRLAKQIGASLEIALFANEQTSNAVDALVVQIQSESIPVARYLVLHEDEKSTPAATIEQVEAKLRASAPAAQILAGTDCYFAELNRQRPETRLLDGVCFSINPQVHAFDDASLIETLGAQTTAANDARAIADGKNVAVSPITLQPRFNPNATGPEPETPAGQLPSTVDPRQATPFGYAWTAGSLLRLSASAATSLTYYQTRGWEGVMEREQGCPLPNLFTSKPGETFPLYKAFELFASFKGGQIALLDSSNPFKVEAARIETEDHQRLEHFSSVQSPKGGSSSPKTTESRPTVHAHAFPTSVGTAPLSENPARQTKNVLAIVNYTGKPQEAEFQGETRELPPYSITIVESEAADS